MSGYFYSNCTKLDPLLVKCRSKNVVKPFLHFNRAFFGDLWLISFSGKSSSGNKMEKKRKEKKGKGKENVNKKKGSCRWKWENERLKSYAYTQQLKQGVGDLI